MAADCFSITMWCASAALSLPVIARHIRAAMTSRTARPKCQRSGGDFLCSRRRNPTNTLRRRLMTLRTVSTAVVMIRCSCDSVVNATFEANSGAPLLVFSKSPTPIASWWVSPSKQSYYQKKDHGTNGGNNDRANEPTTNVNPQLGQEPCANKGTNNPDCNIGNETKSAARHKLTCQPTCNKTNQYHDEQALT